LVLGVLKPDADVLAAGVVVGKVTSPAVSPRMGLLALAKLDTGHAADGAVTAFANPARRARHPGRMRPGLRCALVSRRILAGACEYRRV